MHWADNK